ncbi:MAG: hypothetical protein IJ708_07805, partial [Clostridia bacterium]|nr:hypothetical protein [Clostridia bacterium]
MKKLLSVLLCLTIVASLMVVTAASAAEIKDLKTYEVTANEVETWCVQYSQAARDLNVLCNLVDGLLTNNAAGDLVPNAAKEYYSEDGGKTWTFVLNDDMKWVDVNGEIKADVTSEDWLTGLEWVLNYAKNDASNTSMPKQMIVGATEYYEYTKALAESDGADAAIALTYKDKFAELVGVTAPDEKTIVYTCIGQLPYFPSVATYNCLYPAPTAQIAEIGLDYKAVTPETMWYSGP